MKKIFSLILVLCMFIPLLLSVTVSATGEDVTVDGITYTTAAKYCIIKSCDAELSGDVVIPDFIEFEGKELPVKIIEENAFYYCNKITSLVIPDGVTSVGEDAFSFCSELKSIILPDSIKEIGKSAFYYCDKLESVVIPKDVKTVGSFMFAYCTALKSVTLPDGLLELGVGGIGGSVFINCENLESVTIPDSVRVVETYSIFSGCKKLKYVNIPEGTTETIGQYAFQGCESLESIVIPDSVTEIEMCAFDGCTYLETMKMPRRLTRIGFNAFNECGSLTRLIIPKTIESIYYAFDRCYSLEKVYYIGTEDEWKQKDIDEEGNKLMIDVLIFHPVHEYGEDKAVCSICGYERLRGDVNEDGALDNKDVVMLFRYASSGEKAEDEWVYDFNCDGMIDNKDVVSLFRYISSH